MEKEDADMAKLDRYFNTPVRKRSSDPKLARPGPQSSRPQVDASKAGDSRSSGPVSKTKILSKLPNGGRIPSENRKHSWEKPEPKKNRPANNKPSGSFSQAPPVIESRTNPLSLNKTGPSAARVNSTNLTENISISKTGNSSLNKTGSSVARVNNSLNKTGSSEVKQWGSQGPRPQKSRQPKKPNTSGSGPHLSASKLGEESGGVKAKDVKAKDVNKRKRGADLEKGAGSSLQKMSGGNGNVQKKKRVLILSDDEDFAVDDLPVKKQETRPVRPVSDDKPQTAATTTKQRTARPRAGRKPPVKKCVNPKGKARAGTASPLIPGQVEDDKEEILAAAKAAIAPAFAPKDILWRTTEQFFKPLSGDDMAFISKEIGSHTNLTGDDILAKKGKAENISPGSVSNGDEILTGSHLKAADVDPTLDQIVKGPGARSAPAGISISQTLMSAIISPDEIAMIEQSISNGQNDSNTPADLFEEASGTFRNPNDVIKLSEASISGSGSGSAATSAVVVPYEKMSFDERILFELHELGVYPDVSDPLTNDQGDKSAGTSSKKPDLATTSGQDSIDDEIAKLQAELSQNISDKNALLIKAEQAAKSEKESQYREFSKRALDNLLLQANKTSQASRKRKGSKLSAEGFMRRTLDRVKEFEKTGISVFDEKEYRDLFDAYVFKSGQANDISTAAEKAPAGKRKRGEGPSLSKPKKAQKREGLPPLYPKIKQKQEKGKEEEKEKEKGAGLVDLAGLPLSDDIPEIGDLGGVAEVDSMGLDIPMDDLSDLFF